MIPSKESEEGRVSPLGTLSTSLLFLWFHSLPGLQETLFWPSIEGALKQWGTATHPFSNAKYRRRQTIQNVHLDFFLFSTNNKNSVEGKLFVCQSMGSVRFVPYTHRRNGILPLTKTLMRHSVYRIRLTSISNWLAAHNNLFVISVGKKIIKVSWVGSTMIVS